MKKNVMKLLSRRLFLKAAAAFLALLGALGLAGRYFIWPRRSEIYQAYVQPSAKESYGDLDAGEMLSLLALAEVLYPVSDDAKRKELAGVVEEWARVRTEKDGKLGQYREGIATIAWAAREAGAGESFPALSLTERLRVLKIIEPPAEERPGSGDAGAARQLRYLLTSLLNYGSYRRWTYLKDLREELITGIYSSHLGWSQVGYETWPGVAGDPLGYTRPPPAPID